MKRKYLLKNNDRILGILFITWFLYSFGILGYVAFNDKIPPHCLNLENNG